jgi:hypothetical protein
MSEQAGGGVGASGLAEIMFQAVGDEAFEFFGQAERG